MLNEVSAKYFVVKNILIPYLFKLLIKSNLICSKVNFEILQVGKYSPSIFISLNPELNWRKIGYKNESLFKFLINSRLFSYPALYIVPFFLKSIKSIKSPSKSESE